MEFLRSAPVSQRFVAATGSAFAAMQCVKDKVLELGQVDVMDCFYQIELPSYLRKHFGMKPVRAGSLGITHTSEGVRVSPDRLVYPRLKVCPFHAFCFRMSASFGGNFTQS